MMVMMKYILLTKTGTIYYRPASQQQQQQKKLVECLMMMMIRLQSIFFSLSRMCVNMAKKK